MDKANVSGFPTVYAPDLLSSVPEGRMQLGRSEAHHLRVLRSRPGSGVVVTDGRGSRWSGALDALDRSGAAVSLVGPLAARPVLPIDLGVGVGSRSRMLWLVEKATELGVRRITPIEFSRSKSVADGGRSAAFWEKAGSRALTALKQSGGAWLPSLDAPVTLDSYLNAAPSHQGPWLLLDRLGAPLWATLSDWNGIDGVRIVVGPEGGPTADEVSRCRASGFVPSCLSRQVLRFETAAVVALGIVGQRTLAATDAQQL